MDQIPLAGTLNFRAVASYPARGGRLRRQALYRSGDFHEIPAAGVEIMRGLDVTTVFDLRSDTEKKRRASALAGVPGFRVATEPHDFRNGDLRALLHDVQSTPRACADMMTSIYAQLPRQFAHIYGRYIRTVLECARPVALHCAAGKDRTGVGMALLLDLLGVSRDDIRDDYLKTNAIRDQLRERFRRNESMVGYSAATDHLIEPIITADADYLDAMFAALERDFGDTRRYAVNQLGFTEGELQDLSRRLIA